ncbi:AraC family transcriptional regulator [Alteromonas sp. AMM-1]|uniref:AraC family transcriptional regulator n=1 Tax=Alteromonas sp. AMM-1 TaxID=3394233 RepID=UPI0039A642A4
MIHSEQGFSVIGSWPLVISRAVNAYGIDGMALLTQVGIEPSQASLPEARCDLLRLNRLWRLATNVTGDPALGLAVARFVRPTSWHALGFAIWASDTMRDGFARLSDNFRMFADYGELHIQHIGDNVEIALHRDHHIADWSPMETDAFIGTCVLTARHIYRPDFRPQQVWLSRPMPDDTMPWQRLFKCPVYFNAGYDRIIFPTEAMHQPLLTASHELALQNDVLVAEYIARLDRANLRARLESLLLSRLPLGSITVQKASDELGISLRTLQRRLTEKHTSFGQILDELRKKQAHQWMKAGNLPLSEISYRLGFQHAGNFTRAFKRWFQQTPQQWRNAAG